ncbi:uncharacterized protein TNCV_1393681 [Trichonephila clavipes]|nr:uncharacterized protein TNCV_1393681 [Trichonephila clavipes]
MPLKHRGFADFPMTRGVIFSEPSMFTFTCRNCGGGDRGRVAIYRPFGEVSLSLNRTVTCMVLKANDRRTSCPCHDEFRGPRSDYVRQSSGMTDDFLSKSKFNLEAFLKSIPRMHCWLEIYANLQSPKTPQSIIDKVPYRSVTVGIPKTITREKWVTVVRRPGKFRSKTTTPVEDRYLTINIRHHRGMTPKDIAQDFAVATGNTIYRHTVYRCLAKKAHYARWALVCVLPNPSQKISRLLGSQEHVVRHSPVGDALLLSYLRDLGVWE